MDGKPPSLTDCLVSSKPTLCTVKVQFTDGLTGGCDVGTFEFDRTALFTPEGRRKVDAGILEAARVARLRCLAGRES